MTKRTLIYAFFALLRAETDETEVKRIRTANKLQDELTEDFIKEAGDLVGPDTKEIPFTGNDAIGTGQVLVIKSFKLPNSVIEAVKNPDEPSDLKPNAQVLHRLKAVFAGAYDSKKDKIICYFQAFNRSKVIEPSRALIFKANQFQKMKESGLRLDVKLAAMFRDDKLYFLSNGVKSFLDITAYFQQATDSQIKDFLTQPAIVAADLESVVSAADSWARQRYYGILQSAVLANVSPGKIRKEAKQFGIDVEVIKKNGEDAIRFPQEKARIRELLKFLNEEYFVGILTRTQFETPVKLQFQRKT